MILPFRMGPAASRSVLCDIDRVLLGVAKLRVKKLGTSCTNKICRHLGFLDFHFNRNNFVRTSHFLTRDSAKMITDIIQSPSADFRTHTKCRNHGIYLSHRLPVGMTPVVKKFNFWSSF